MSACASCVTELTAVALSFASPRSTYESPGAARWRAGLDRATASVPAQG
jgi:hypothetical protein